MFSSSAIHLLRVWCSLELRAVPNWRATTQGLEAIPVHCGLFLAAALHDIQSDTNCSTLVTVHFLCRLVCMHGVKLVYFKDLKRNTHLFNDFSRRPLCATNRCTHTHTHTHRRCKRHSGESSLHDMPLVDKGCQHQPGFGMAAFSTTTRCLEGHIPIVPPGKKEQIPITARSNAGSQCAWYVLGYFTGFSWIGALPRAAWWHPDCTRRPKWVAGACHPNCLGSKFRWWDLRPFRKEYRCPWALGSEFEMG